MQTPEGIDGRAAPPVVNPQRPTPGITGMTEYLRQAVATDLNDRIRDNNTHDTRRIVATHDLDISQYWRVDPEGIPPRLPPARGCRSGRTAR